jgi:hypothetical protein
MIENEPNCTDKTHTGILHHCTNLRIAYKEIKESDYNRLRRIQCLSHVHIIRWILSILFHMLFNKIFNHPIDKFILSFRLHKTLRK